MAGSSSLDLLVAAGFKVKELAALLHCDRATVWKWRKLKQPPVKVDLVTTLLLDLVHQVGAARAVKQVRRKGVVLRLLPCGK